MNNLLKRFFFGAIYVAVLIWAFSNPIYIGVVFMLVGIIGTIELKKILDKQNILIDIWPVLILGISSYISVIYPDKKGIIILGLLIYTISITFYANSNSIRKIGSTLFCICYIFVPLALAIPIAESNNTFKSNTLIGLFILIWASDSWAFILGKLFGRRKLFEKISPNKTIEGFVGSLILTSVSGGFIGQKYLALSIIEGVFLGGLTVCIATFGDLFQSMLKRASNVKDSGNILPGHGGILDRFDSILFCLPVYYVYFNFIRPLF